MLVVYIVLDEARERAFAQRSAATAPPVYRERVRTMTSRTARAHTMAGLWLVEQGLAILGEPAERIRRLGFGPGGRPQLAGGPFFSVSHSAALVACALDPTRAIGLDVEQRRDGISPRLRAAIAPGGDFFDAWCAREATVKASGRVGLARVRATRIDGATARLDDRDWHLARPRLIAGYAACVAGPRPWSAVAMDGIDCGDRLSRVRGG